MLFFLRKWKPPQRCKTFAAVNRERLHETLDAEQLHVLFHRADSADAEVLDEHFGHIGR